MPLPPPVDGRFKLDEEFARKDHGLRLYFAIYNKTLFFVKRQKDGPKGTLLREISFLKLLANSSNPAEDCPVPQIVWEGLELRSPTRSYHSLVLPIYDFTFDNMFLVAMGPQFQRQDVITCAAFFAVGMMSAVRYIHSKGVIHCDLRPNNFMVSSSNQVVLIDFEGACVQGQERPDSVANQCDPMFASPHLLRSRKTPFKSDDRIALASVLMYLALDKPLPWKDLACDLCQGLFTSLGDACEQLAQAKEAAYETCCEGLPDVFAEFLRDALLPSASSCSDDDMDADDKFDWERHLSGFRLASGKDEEGSPARRLLGCMEHWRYSRADSDSD